MGKSVFNLSTFCVLFVLAALWTPAYTEDKCTLGCKGTPTTPGFLSGHKYTYAIEGTVSIFLSGADKQETSVKLLGQVAVSGLGNCGHVLKVQNLIISGPDGKKYGKPAGLDKPVRFTLQDGFAGSDICSEEGDTRRSLNIKRAIISLLQTGQKSSTEIDIFGACPTDSSSSKEGAATIIHRNRDLSKCGHREHGKNDLITAVYNPHAEIKNTQILHSILNVESKVNNGVPEKVSATEEYLYKPFSVGENGARAGVKTKLTLTGQASGADNGNFNEAHSIIFENPHGVPSEHSNFNTALKAVKDTAKHVADNTNVQSAGLFAQTVRVLRYTNKDDLLKVYNQVKGNNVEKRVFLDALLRAGTGYSIEVSIEILKQKSLTPLEQKLVYLSLGNARHVTNDAIVAATSLLNDPKVPKELYLGVGALAGAYCRAHNCHHDAHNDGIVALSQKLGAKLHCKPKTKADEDVLVAVLKGIRNIRHLEDSLVDKIAHCAADNNVKPRVRAAAFEAFHADPCVAKLKKTALDAMKNRQLDSEIRIKAYLAVIDCPCGKSANEIKTLLDTEPVHQVGRFITSSLRHIRASANPDKKLARQHYGLISTPNKFNVDDRKYSFYREASYNIDTLGIGSSLEQTVIYSQDSFLPRSASLNLTAEIFGHNVNVFEVGGRQGNLDRVMEHFLGPKSVFRTEDPQKLFDDIVKRFKETEQKVEGKLRGRRAIKADIDNFDKHIKAEGTPYNDELDLDIYVKLFGTDAVFLSLGDDKGFNYNKVLDEFLKSADSSLNQAKHFQHEYRSHLLFLDAELAYATSTGLSLKLQLIGSATGRLEISTNIDFKQIIRDPKNAKVDFKLVPSSNVEIAGVFLVDADSVSTGLKVVTNLHSSTGGHVIAKVLENGQGFDLQLGLPIEKQEIVTATNDLVFFSAEKGQIGKDIAIKTDVDKKEYAACFDQLSGVVGLTLCGDISVPFSVSGPEAQASIQKFLARYPLTGSSKVKIHLEKNDLRGYHIKGVLKTSNPEKKSFELLLEAEGKQNRKTSLTGELVNSKEEKSLTIDLESPIKTLHGQVSLLTKPNEYVAMVKAKMDAEEYYAKAGFNVEGNEQRSVFRPVAEYQMPGGQGKKALKVDGQIIREKSGQDTKYTFQDIKVNMPNNEVVDINGHVGVGRAYEVDIKAKKGDHNALLTFTQKGHEAKLEFQNTLNPYINFKADVFSQNEKGNVHNDIDLFYGGDSNNQQNRVTINQQLKYHGKGAEEFGLITKNKFAIHALPLIAVFDAEADPKKLDVKVEGQYMEKKGDMEIEARTKIKKEGDYSIKFKANLDKKGVEAFAKRDIDSAEKSNLENYILIKGVGKYELSGVVHHRVKPNDLHVGAIGHLKISGGKKNEDISFDVGVTENPKLCSANAKISQSKTELINFLVKVNRGTNPSGELKMNLKDTITANGQYKVTDANGKGNGLLIVDFKKSQRKIKGDIKFEAKAPIFKAEVDMFLNFEKDNADKIHISTSSKHEAEKLTESKNKINYAGKNFEFNIHHEGSTEVNGKCKSHAEVILPNGRHLSVNANRDLTVKDGVMNGQGEILLSDAEKQGGPASTVSYKHKVIDTNIEKNNVNYEGELHLKTKQGQELKHSFQYKDSLQGKDMAKVEYKSDLTGTMIEPASVALTFDFTDPEKSLIDGSQKYHVKANYGNDFALELNGSGELKIVEKGDKKYKEDNTIHVILPFEKAHDIKIVTNYDYLFPENKDVAIEYSVLEMVQINADVYKFENSAKFGKKEGFSKLKVIIPHVDPFNFDINYNADLESDSRFAKIDMKSTYGKGKTADIEVDVKSANHVYDLIVKAHAPQAEKLKKLEFNVKAKKPSPDSYNNALTIDVDGKVYKSDMTIVYSKAQPVFDISYTNPDTQKTSRFYIKGNALSSNQGKIEIKIDNIKDTSFHASSEGSVTKDNVVFKVQADSEKLGLKHYTVDIASKDSGSGKRLEFHVTNDNKNVLSGSTSFISKQEGQKTIIEGSGSVKVKEEQKSATFKYIRTMLTEGVEQGVETFVNVAIGDRSYVAESRVTNLEYKTSYVYCEEKKQCAHAELHSKLNIQKPGVAQHTVNVNLDLRKLGFAPEFGLQMNNEVSERKLPQYNLDVYMNKEAKKYHLHVFSTPEHGKLPAGITITLPSRVIALESLVVYPADKAMPFPIRADLAMYLDKRKPNMKTAVRMLLDVTGDAKQHGLDAEFGFSHPKLGKEAVLKFVGKMQRPSQDSIKIESIASASIPSLGNDRQAKVIFEASPIHIKAFIDTPLVQIIDLEGSNKLGDKVQESNLKFSLLNGKPVSVKALAKEFKYFEFSTGYSDEAERKLTIIGHIDPEKRVDITADIILSNEKKNIAHGAIYLQDNLVKSDYGASNDNFNYFVNALKNDLKNLENRIKEVGEKANADLKNTLQRVEPTLKKLNQSYREELESLFNEISNDQTLKEISQAFYDVLAFVSKLVNEVMEATKPICEKIQATITDLVKKSQDMYSKKVEPQLKELYNNISQILHHYFDGLIDVVAHFAAIVTDFIEKHKPELQELTNTLTEIFKDISHLLIAQLKEFRVSAGNMFEEFFQQVKEMPIFAMIKEKFQELAVPDQVLALLSEAHQAIRMVLPTEETKNFADAVYDYVEKKLRNQKVDDAGMLRAIYEKFAVALTSSLQFIRQQLNQYGVPSAINFNVIPYLTSPQSTLPALGAPPSFSFVNQLLHGDLPDPLALIRAYRPRSLNPLDELPAKLRAVVVNGQHIFTFDGRHLTFPGSCRYVLAHDFVDRNFTLVLHLQNGAPKALILEDKNGAIIELKENGQVAVNGAAHGFPVVEKASFAFRAPNNLIGLGTSYGLMAFCTSKLEVCYIDVNGFYSGKLRGLLGDGNNEEYDDFRLPNGKIVSSEAEFGNAYKVTASCPAAKTPEHSAHQHHGALPAACEEVFGASSPLRPLALVLDVRPFRQACVHAVASDSANALHQACDLGRGYAALAVTGLLPAVLPAACVQCTDADKPRKVGETYEFKLPAKQADVVVAVEITQPNEKTYKDLIVPLVGQIVDSLKAKHIDDIKVHLVGITSKMPFVYLYDADNKLKGAKIKFTDESRYFHIPTIETGNQKIDEYNHLLSGLVDEFRYAFGLTNVVAGYNQLLQLPLRAGAVKHILTVVGEQCKDSVFFVEELRKISYFAAFHNNAITTTLVTVTHDLDVKGHEAKNVIGYDSDSVLFVDNKKKGDKTVRDSITHHSDGCIDFVEGTEGMVLSSSNFATMNAGQQKQFIKAASTSVVEKMLEKNLEQRCVCSYVDAFRVRSVCFNTDEKEARRRK